MVKTLRRLAVGQDVNSQDVGAERVGLGRVVVGVLAGRADELLSGPRLAGDQQIIEALGPLADDRLGFLLSRRDSGRRGRLAEQANRHQS